MTRDLDDPYAFEKKPLHYIPGYTGHLPLNRERFGINYREASADTIAMQKKKESTTRSCRSIGDAQPLQAAAGRLRAEAAQPQPEVCAGGRGRPGGGDRGSALPPLPSRPGPVWRLPGRHVGRKARLCDDELQGRANNIPDDPTSLASRIAHRRVARTKRNLNGGLFRPDLYDDSTVDDIAALDPRLKILQSRTEYRSDASATMQTSSEELFDMRDDGAVYGGGAALQ